MQHNEYYRKLSPKLRTERGAPSAPHRRLSRLEFRDRTQGRLESSLEAAGRPTSPPTRRDLDSRSHRRILPTRRGQRDQRLIPTCARSRPLPSNRFRQPLGWLGFRTPPSAPRTLGCSGGRVSDASSASGPRTPNSWTSPRRPCRTPAATHAELRVLRQVRWKFSARSAAGPPSRSPEARERAHPDGLPQTANPGRPTRMRPEPARVPTAAARGPRVRRLEPAPAPADLPPRSRPFATS